MHNGSVEAVKLTKVTDDVLGTLYEWKTGDPVITIAAGADYLLPGTFSKTYTEAGSYTNIAWAYAVDNEGNEAKDDDTKTVTVTDVMPTVDLTKTVTPATLVEPGGVFHFTLTIKNTSVEEVTITDLTDTNTLSAGCLALINTKLAAGASTSCTYDVTHIYAGVYPNTASVTVKDNEDNSASDSDSKTVTVVPQGGALLPTQKTCYDYVTGNWYPMYSNFSYQVKGNKISSVSPGVIFYYNTITAPSASFDLTVVETNPSLSGMKSGTPCSGRTRPGHPVHVRPATRLPRPVTHDRRHLTLHHYVQGDRGDPWRDLQHRHQVLAAEPGRPAGVNKKPTRTPTTGRPRSTAHLAGAEPASRWHRRSNRPSLQ